MNSEAADKPAQPHRGVVPLDAILGRWTGRDMAAFNAAAFGAGRLVGAGEALRLYAERRLRTAAVTRGYEKLVGIAGIAAAIEGGMSAGIMFPAVAANDNEPGPIKRAPIAATPYEWLSPSEVPLREFVYGTHLIRRYLSIDAAPGGVGKSAQVVVDALAMVTGRPLLGLEPNGKSRVWLWNGEDPREEIERRISAACGHYRIDQAALGGRLFVDSGREQEIIVMTENRTGTTTAHPVIDAVKKTIRENQIDVLVVDPFVTTHAVSENDNNRMAAVAKIWAQIANDENCAVQLVHHVRKSDRREVTADDVRGGGAVVNAARHVRLLVPMSVKEAKKAEINRDDRFQFFRVVNGKSNLTMRSERSDWRQIVSYAMDNGEGDLGRPPDHVGVVVRWQWPSAATVVEDVADGALDTIKAGIRAGDYREHVQAHDWAGKVVAGVLEIDLKDPDEKRRVSRMLTAWIADGHFEVAMGKNGKREDKRFLRVKEAAAPPHLDS